MKQASRAAALAIAVLTGATMSAGAGGSRPIVVELYTSQGCSSCPPADAILGKLAKRPGLIALSLPVTYWDMLGWKDTLASDASTRRQKAYAAALGRGGVYTPQMIVDGTGDVVGSHEEEVNAAIDSAVVARDISDEAVKHGGPSVAHTAWSIDVGLSQTPKNLHVAVAAAPNGIRKSKPNATIWMYRVRSSVTVHIAGGENNGRTATYSNVVADLKSVGRWTGEPVSLDVPRAGAPAHDGVVVLVQQGGYGRVIGAAYLGHTDYYAEQ